MFSGIIQTTQKASKIESGKGYVRLHFKKQRPLTPRLGDSVSVDGICSTVEKVDKNSFAFYLMPETLKRTNLNTLRKNHLFNLELPLTPSTLISGHLVSGHIDTIAKAVSITNENGSAQIEFQINPKFTKYIIYKGSIAVNGVSLTVVSVNKNSFSVSLIPFTIKNTNLGQLIVGDTANIEVDQIAKYIEKLK